MALIKRQGFGQVEPNQLANQDTKQIYAQLPAADSIEILENGQFAIYDYAAGEVSFTGDGEPYLVFNEIKTYRNGEGAKDFALIKENYTPGGDITHYGVGPFPGQMTPRLLKTEIGDIYTTNMVGQANTSATAVTAGIELVVGDYLAPNESGILVKKDKEGTEGMLWKVVRIFTVPDGQPGVKLQRVR